MGLMHRVGRITTWHQDQKKDRSIYAGKKKSRTAHWVAAAHALIPVLRSQRQAELLKLAWWSTEGVTGHPGLHRETPPWGVEGIVQKIIT